MISQFCLLTFPILLRWTNSYGDPSKSTEQKVQIMQDSHTDLSKTSNKSIECTCVAIIASRSFCLLHHTVPDKPVTGD